MNQLRRQSHIPVSEINVSFLPSGRVSETKTDGITGGAQGCFADPIEWGEKVGFVDLPVIIGVPGATGGSWHMFSYRPLAPGPLAWPASPWRTAWPWPSLLLGVTAPPSVGGKTVEPPGASNT